MSEAHWISRILSDLSRREDEKIVFSTAKTPSGPIHVGVGRELVYCGVFERLLRSEGKDTEFLFFVDDFDSLKSFPPNTPKEYATREELLGRPMYSIPCPYGHCESWGKHFAKELIDTFETFGLYPTVIWSHELYNTAAMKNIIRLSLDKVGELRRILVDILGPTLEAEKLETLKREMSEWYPCLVLCEQCERLRTTKITGWNHSTDTITYRCQACGRQGEVKLSEWAVKLRWRIDWPAKWALFKVSCEPAGKDHCVRGGAYDTGEAIVTRVFAVKAPYRIPYEWILLGERAMKTHKGISFTFSEWLAVAPPEIYRYLILREDPRKHISFAPERLLQLVDEFERAERIYYGLEKASSEAEESVMKVIYPLSMTAGASEIIPARLPYRFAVIISQLTPLLDKEKISEKCVSIVRKIYGNREIQSCGISALEQRLSMAKYWVNHYASDELKIRITEAVPREIRNILDAKQKEALRIIMDEIGKDWEEAGLQYEIFEVGKKLGIGGKVFEAFYLVFLGKKYGPRLAPFLLSLDKGFILQRLKEALE